MKTPDGGLDYVRATYFYVDTGKDCFSKQSVAKYSIVFMGQTVELTVSQVGPRLFVSKCTDNYSSAHPIKTSCLSLYGPISPEIHVQFEKVKY